MKKAFVPFVTFVLLFSTSGFLPPAADGQPQKGGVLPVINLPIPENPDERNYLGISGNGFFKFPRIKAKAVIVEIFSLYCPYCQKDAPGLNDLYRLIESNPDIKDKIKLIGIGAGNSVHEVSIFKKTYQVPFPLFPDEDFTIHEACGGVRTPYFIIVKINEDGSHEIVHTQSGGYPGPEPFLQLVLGAVGLNR